MIWYSVINSIIHQWWSGMCYCLLLKNLYLTCTCLKNYLMYLMSSKYSEYLNLQIWKSNCTWLKYFEKYLTPTLIYIYIYNINIYLRNKEKLFSVRMFFSRCLNMLPFQTANLMASGLDLWWPQIAMFMGPPMGPTWVLSAPDGPHFGPMNLAIRAVILLL